MSKIKSNKIKCHKCKVIIESRHRHDFRYCPCGAVFVDGGNDYLRRGFTSIEDFEELSEYEDEQI